MSGLLSNMPKSAFEKFETENDFRIILSKEAKFKLEQLLNFQREKTSLN